MAKKYVVRLNEEERGSLKSLVSKGKAAVYKSKHAPILLLSDVEGQGWTDEQIAQALSVHRNTVRGVRQRLVEEGLEAALGRKKQAHPSRPPLLDGEGQARLIALRCGPPPPGRSHWSLHLLADQWGELRVVEGISHETVRRVLKKTNWLLIGANATASRPSKMENL